MGPIGAMKMMTSPIGRSDPEPAVVIILPYFNVKNRLYDEKHY